MEWDYRREKNTQKKNNTIIIPFEYQMMKRREYKRRIKYANGDTKSV